jgi:hypothetical protein
MEWNGKPVRSVRKGFAAAVKAAELPVNGLHQARRAQKQQDALQGRSSYRRILVTCGVRRQLFETAI